MSAPSPIQKVLAELEAKGFKPQRRGEAWETRCPAHEDNRASLSVSEGQGAKVLVKCHAGCEAKEVVSRLGLAMRDLFPARTSSSRIAAQYPYTDESGQLLFEVVRLEPKDFRQRTPDGAGGWIWNAKGVCKVLYRLPEVVKAAKQEDGVIWVVEGEKDADALAKLGLTATTNAGGAGKWRQEYSEALRGACMVVVLPDSDEPGRKHAQAVARSLAGLVGEVKVLALPGPGKDVSDWLAAGGTRERLEHLVAHGEPAPELEIEPPQEYSRKTETALAEAFIARHGEKLRYVGQWGKWLVWDGTRWALDAQGDVQRLLKETLRDELARAEKEEDAAAVKAVLGAESRNRRESVVALARYEAPVQAAPEALDADPWAFNVANGTLDLRTGKLLPHDRGALCTKASSIRYDPAAESPLWQDFLWRVFSAKPDVITFVQRAVGYSLTGSVAEQCLFVLWGSGANGKSTFLNALLSLLGDYGRSGVQDLLVAKAHESHPTELADLFGQRFVVFQETQEGQRFDESKVKALTGGDKVKARRMREDFWEFSPTHKLWLGTNHRPNIRGTDTAIWRRIRLVPFSVTIPPDERDGKLADKLRAELPGILQWAVQGCLEWQRKGLQPPREVTEAVEEYRREEDRLQAFIDECCVQKPGNCVASGFLYSAYQRWAENGGEKPMNKILFSRRIAEKGFGLDRIGHERTRTWSGLALREDRQPPTRGEDGRYGYN